MKRRLQQFEDLTVWRKAHQLVLEVYRMTASFPKEEKFGLVSQMRRAAVSIPANIAEGFKKTGSRDKANFYNIAQGSLEELRYYPILSMNLGYASDTAVQQAMTTEIGKMLHGLIRAVRGNDG